MQIDSKTLLCRYRYDALNRLVASTPSAQADTQRFYLKDRLTTEIQGAEQRSIMQHEDQLLAQQQRQSGTVETRLLATDQQRSVVNVLAAARRNFLAYTPYGHRPPENGLLSLLGFNGERPDPVTGCYLLGNGYRAFNPVLMRFNSPDSWSPFGYGGLNGYAYCVGDPVNRYDPNGHVGLWSIVKNNLSKIAKMKKSSGIATTPLESTANSTATAITQGKTKTLVNAFPELLGDEIQQLNNSYLAKGRDPRKIISEAKDLMSRGTGVEQKFVLNDLGQMATAVSGGKGENMYISHPSIAEILNSQRIISSGTLWTGSMGEIVIYNRSGHYRPSFEDLTPAINHLRKLGFDPEALPFN
jgi:RHS repeat-associated protein